MRLPPRRTNPAVDGFGDRSAILGVSLWRTIPPLASPNRRDRLPIVWCARLVQRPWPVDRRDAKGWNASLRTASGGGPIGPPLLFMGGAPPRSPRRYSGRHERPNC